jgi:hypothetical protein
MPIVRIDVLEGWAPADLERVGDAVQTALVETLGVPERAPRRAVRVRPVVPRDRPHRSVRPRPRHLVRRTVDRAEAGVLRTVVRAARPRRRSSRGGSRRLPRREHPGGLVVRARRGELRRDSSRGLALGAGSVGFAAEQDPEIRLPRPHGGFLAAGERGIDLGDMVEIVDSARSSSNRSISVASGTPASRSTCAKRSNGSNGRPVPSLMIRSARGIQSSSSAEMRWPTTSRGVHPPGVSGVSSHVSGSPSSRARTTRGVRSRSAPVSARNVPFMVRWYGWVTCAASAGAPSQGP